MAEVDDLPFPISVTDFGPKGRGCTATRDITKGDVVIVCAPVSTAVNDSLMQTVCCGCMRSCRTLCSKCNLVAICDRCSIPGCRSRVMHDDECDSIKLLFESPLFQRPFRDSRTLRLMLRLLYYRARERTDTLPPLVPSQFESQIPDVLTDGMAEIAELQDHAEDLSPQLEATFVETAKQLKYLVAPWARASIDQYCALLSRYYCNAFELESTAGSGWVGVGLFPSASYFNHDCDSNCRFAVDEWGFLRVFTTRPLRAGEELTIPYVNPAFPVARRQARLQKHFFFRCGCKLCAAGQSREEGGRLVDTRKMKWDDAADSDQDVVSFVVPGAAAGENRNGAEGASHDEHRRGRKRAAASAATRAAKQHH